MRAILLMLISLSSIPVADARPPSLTRMRGESGNHLKCADRTAVLDVIAQQSPPDELIIVIVRLGSGETRPQLNRRRLHNVRAYWTEFLDGEYRRKPETIILAEGERVTGGGRLEIYVGGKLIRGFEVAHNSDVDFGNCYPPDDSYLRGRVYNPCRVESHRIFYPCRGRVARRRNRR